MKAIRISAFGGPEVLQLADVPDPKPGPGQVLVRIFAAGVNPVETYIRAGTYAKLPELPCAIGSDGAGMVEAVGAGVERLSKGQRVWMHGSISGSYAELATADAARVHPLPEGVSFEEGAALGIPCSTAYRALFQRGGAKTGETVLVHGATGGVGVAAVQFAKAAGLRVLATGGTDAGCKMLAEIGADAVFDHTTARYEEAIREAAGGNGVNLIIEMLANVNLARDLGLLGRGGRVVVVGNRGSIEINPRDLMLRDADVRGVMVSNTPPAELAECHSAINAGLASGALRPVIGRVFPLADAAQAHAAVMAAGHCGKIVLTKSHSA